MRNNVDRNESEYKTEFARRLAASFFSMQLGVTLQTAYKKYAENNAVGDYWLTVADAIIADHTGQKALEERDTNGELQ